MNLKILRAVVKKDVLSLYPLVALSTMLFAGDVFVTRLELLPLWTSFQTPLLLLATTALILSVFQLDAPVSLVDDWLCRPVPRAELLTAKLLLVFTATYLSRALATFSCDLILGTSVVEALEDAVLIQDPYFQLLLPILLITAVVTNTLIQGIGVLIALFVCVFMIPTPLIQRPGPLEPGIGEALRDAGLGWLMLAPAKVAPLFMVALTYHVVYWRRQILHGRVLLIGTTLATLFLVVLPMWILPWRTTASLQSATLSKDRVADQAIIDAIRLRSPRACFPATRIGRLASDAPFNAALRSDGLRLWTDDDLAPSGEDSLTFITAIEARPLPLDWRVKLNYVHADYYSGGSKPDYSLRPAFYITDRAGGALLSHAWVLPEFAVRSLETHADTRLELGYSLTLLEPRSFKVPTDGKRHALPDYGYCSAEADTLGNGIDVDCFSAFSKPAQLSAELNGIPASRVFSAADLAPSWISWTHAQRVKLTIGSPRLARHDSITVTAWNTAGYLNKTLSLPGILGARSSTCPLPTRDTNTFVQSRWRDIAPHQTYSISVDEGVQLEVLDFGGSGMPIMLLPGLGATAHSYDDFAPLLVRDHHVVAMTRRGTGYSSKPDYGFDTPRLGQDVLQVMDAMNLKQVLLVGSSIAGDELTWLGVRHPERFSGLVYLDAAYDRSGDRDAPAARRIRELNRRLPPEPPTPPGALRNYQAMTQYLEDNGHLTYPEGELVALFNVSNPFLAGVPSIDARTQQAIEAGIQAPDYASLKIPALAIYAFPGPDEPLPPWYDPNDKELIAAVTELGRISIRIKRANIELFRDNVANGQVIEMQNARHGIVLSNREEVLEAIEKFASSLQP